MRLLATGEFGLAYRESGILRGPQEGVHPCHCLRGAAARVFNSERACEGGGQGVDPRGIMNPGKPFN
jgi:hypothetical protein